MAKAWYRGISGAARKVVNSWRGVSGVARRITNGYRGVSGAAREFYRALPYWVFDSGVYSSNCTINSANTEMNGDGYLELNLNCTNSTSSDGGGYSIGTLVDNFTAGDTLTLKWDNSSSTLNSYHDKKLAFRDEDGNYLNNPSGYGAVLGTGTSGEYTTTVPEGTATVSIILVDGRSGTHESTWIVTSLVIGSKTYV